MSRIVPAEEFDLIEQGISEYSEGIGISALEKVLARHLPKALNRRTLQRRLERLLVDKRIETEGESIALALVYKSAPSVGSTADPLVAQSSIGGEAEAYLPVSPERGVIRDLVRQPLMWRKPVGYQRSFLEEYEPGVTFYLSESLRVQFHEIVRCPSVEAGPGPAAPSRT